jgi:hypothetical protein
MRTLKIILLGLLSGSLFLPIQTNAQAEFGVKGGLNLSNLYVDEVDDEDVRIGYHAGVFVNAPVVSFFSIQPELIFSTKGSTVKYDMTFFSGEYTFALNYIDLPVLGVFHLSEAFNIHVGPYAGYLVSARAINRSDNGFDFDDEISRSNFKDFDYGLAGGLGFRSDWFHAGLRYNYGLREIGEYREVLGQSFRVSNAKNAVGQIYIGISF